MENNKTLLEIFAKELETEPNILSMHVESIDKWYDRRSKNWIVQKLDVLGNQIGDAIIVYSKREADAEEESLRKKYNVKK